MEQYPTSEVREDMTAQTNVENFPDSKPETQQARDAVTAAYLLGDRAANAAKEVSECSTSRDVAASTKGVCELRQTALKDGITKKSVALAA